MNGAKVIRSTFGFIDTEGKPNELFFFSPVVTENQHSTQIFRTKYGATHPLDAQWVRTGGKKKKKKKKPEPGSNWSLL